jgi:hypothetical protein
MQPKRRRPGAKDPRAKMTKAERKRAAPPSTEADHEVFVGVLRRLVSTPAPPREKRTSRSPKTQ